MDRHEFRSQEYPIALVKVGQGRRAVDDAAVAEMVASIREVGLLNPITLNMDGTLIAGRHRLEAARRLGWSSIASHVVVMNDVDAAIAEIDENLVNNPPIGLERAELVARRKREYEKKHPEAKPEAKRAAARWKKDGSPNDTVSLGDEGLDATPITTFTENTAAATGMTIRSIQRDVQIAEKITPEVKEMIRDTAVVEHKTDLLAIARTPVEEQPTVAQEYIERRALPMEDYRAKRNAMREERESEEAAAQAELDRVARLADPKGLLARNKVQEAYRDNLAATVAFFKVKPASLIPLLSDADRTHLEAYLLTIRAWCDDVEQVMAPGPRAMGGRNVAVR